MFMFKSSTLFAAASGAAISLFAQIAGAAYVLGPDAFDVPPYALGDLTGQQSWQLRSGTTASIANTGDASHGTALFMDNDNGGVTGMAYKFLPAHDQSQTLQVKFDVYGSGGGGSYFNMPVASIGDYWYYGGVAANLEGMVTGVFRLNGNNTIVVPDITCSPYTWYTVTLDLSYTDKTYDISITDGVSTGSLTGVPFWSPAEYFSGLNDITFRTADTPNNPYESGYFDNLSIEVIPEPAALSLLGLGALALRRRK